MAKRLIPRSVGEIIQQRLAIEFEEAQSAGQLGFMARIMTLASLPHSHIAGNEFERRNGKFFLSIMSPARIGLPYGTIPRLLLAWLTTEAVRTRKRELVMGDSLSDFMRQLDMVATGGRWGSITRLRNQSVRLFASSITAIFEDGKGTAVLPVRITDGSFLWWDPKHPDQIGIWESMVTLSQPFFDEIIERPVPIDMRALAALKKSPMALDIYVWLTYRMSYLKKPTVVSWLGLQGQFGASYPQTALGLRHFRQNYLHALKKVVEVYPDAKVQASFEGLRLSQGRPHIAKKTGG